MFDVLSWWIIVEMIGLAVWPIAFWFFRNLPDRGYAFVKPLGLLLLAYPFWLLSSLGFLDNSRGAILLVGIVIAGLSWWWGMKRQAADDGRAAMEEPRAAEDRLRLADGGQLISQAEGVGVSTGTALVGPWAWLKEHIGIVATTELVFTVAFVGWAIVRAYMPDISATEKPMELAFLNGVLKSTHFPPQDPWLSGYAISYYYFGYVIVGMVTLLSGIPSSITFNLAIALLFGLSATGAFGLAYNLIQGHLRDATVRLREVLFALLAPLFLLVVGNLEGLFEALHSRGLGAADFWGWLDVKGLTDVAPNGSLVPTDNWWWWRASRVIHDVVSGQTQEVIDEFPQFSFLLGDMHPHVLALPFVLLALAAALNVLKTRQGEHLRFWRSSAPSADFAQAEARSGLQSFRLGPVNKQFLVSSALLPIIVGSLPFLNFWDVLPYGFVLVAAYAIAHYRLDDGWNPAATRDLAGFVVGLAVVSLILYLPFYVGFQSQAGGILPVLFVKTALHQYLLMFGLFVFITVVFLARLLRDQHATWAWVGRAAPFLAGLVLFPVAVALLVMAVLTASPALRSSADAAFPNTGGSLLTIVLGAYFVPLFEDPWLFVLLVFLLTVVLVLLRTRVLDRMQPDSNLTFVLLLLLTGFLLTLGVEFVYLKDVFGTRMNTVFKFYFQAWTMFSVAAAFGVFYVSRALSGLARGLWSIGLLALIAASLVYPVLAIPNRADNFVKAPTLDGLEWLKESHPDDYAAIEWLNMNAPRNAIVLESTGRAYTYDDRISMATGLPTVLGWINHEDQWRGGTKLFKNEAEGIDRAADVARIYQTPDAKEALTLLDKYAISFVVVGQIERTQYGLSKSQIDKFGQVMKLVFENGDVRIFARSG